MTEERRQSSENNPPKEKLVWESFDLAKALFWSGKYVGDLSGGAGVSWDVEDEELQKTLGVQISRGFDDIFEHCGVSLPLSVNDERIVWSGRGAKEKYRKEFWDFFSGLAMIAQKRVFVYRYFGNTGETKFLFRCDPGEDEKSRFERMQLLHERAVNILSKEDNIGQIWSFGSFERGSVLAQDVDLFCVFDRKRQTGGLSEAVFWDSDYLVVKTPTIDHSLKGPEEPKSNYLGNDILERLKGVSESLGVTLNLQLFPGEIFFHPQSYPIYQELIENVRKGKMVFEKTSDSFLG